MRSAFADFTDFTDLSKTFFGRRDTESGFTGFTDFTDFTDSSEAFFYQTRSP